jgi:hypothetical protein
LGVPRIWSAFSLKLIEPTTFFTCACTAGSGVYPGDHASLYLAAPHDIFTGLTVLPPLPALGAMT